VIMLFLCGYFYRLALGQVIYIFSIFYFCMCSINNYAFFLQLHFVMQLIALKRQIIFYSSPMNLFPAESDLKCSFKDYNMGNKCFRAVA